MILEVSNVFFNMNVSASSDDPQKTYWLIYSSNHNRILQNLGNDGFSFGISSNERRNSEINSIRYSNPIFGIF